MSKSIMVAGFCVLMLIFATGAVADEFSSPFFLVPPGGMLATAYTPTLQVDSKALPSNEALSSMVDEGKSVDFQIKFGEAVSTKYFTYTKFPNVSDYDELSGYRARRDYFRSGAIETKWKPANGALDFVADFFAGSPLLMESEYFVHLSELYGEPFPEW